MKVFENLAKIEDFSNLGKIGRFLKIWEKLKKFENLVKIKDFSNFGKN